MISKVTIEKNECPYLCRGLFYAISRVLDVIITLASFDRLQSDFAYCAVLYVTE